MFVQMVTRNRIHLCFIDMMHCLTVKGVFLDFAECILGSISIFFILCWNQHIKTIILPFSLKKYLALALLLCALLSLSNAQCFHQVLKPGKRKERNYNTHRHRVHLWYTQTFSALKQYQNWFHMMKVLKNIYRRDPLSGWCGWHMASRRIFMEKQ